MKKANLPVISVVVPIHSLRGRSENINHWIGEVKENEVEIVLVLDTVDQDTRQIVQKLIEKNENRTFKTREVDCRNPGGSRNAGLEIATGEWVVFWDCDDIGIPHSLSKIVEDRKIDTEVVVAKARIAGNARNDLVLDFSERETLFNPGIWRFIFRSSSLKGIRFPQLSSGEDQVFLARYRFLERKSETVSDSIYEYHMGHPDQLTNDINRVGDALVAARLVMEATRISPLWKNQYSVMVARLLITYLRRGSDTFRKRLFGIVSEIRTFRDPHFLLVFAKTLISSTSRSIR